MGENHKKQGGNSRVLRLDAEVVKKNPAGLKPEGTVAEPAYADDPIARSLFLVERMRKIGAISHQEYLIAKAKILDEHAN